MNILNRTLIILLLLVAVCVVTLTAAAPAEVMAIAGLASGSLKGLADRLLPAGRAVVGLAGFSLDLLLLFTLWLEIRRPRYRTVRVRQTDGATAEITTQTIKERLEYAVDSLPDVVTAVARTRSYGRSVEVSIDTEIRSGTPVAQKADEIAATVREVTEATMGLALRGKPRIRIQAIRFPEETLAEPEEVAGASAPSAAWIEARVRPSGEEPGSKPATARPSR